MIKRRSQTYFGLRAIILAIAVILANLGSSADCQTAAVSLLLEQIPAQGGTITPGPGVHHFEPDTEVILTATPKPGYKFICWLGDVSNPKASSTVTRINEPKIIIALFESTEYEALPAATGASGGGGSGGATSAAGDMYIGAVNNAPLMIAGAGGKKSEPKVVLPDPALPLWPILTPESSAPAEPVIPEPATLSLLIIGSLFTFTRIYNHTYPR